MKGLDLRMTMIISLWFLVSGLWVYNLSQWWRTAQSHGVILEGHQTAVSPSIVTKTCQTTMATLDPKNEVDCDLRHAPTVVVCLAGVCRDSIGVINRVWIPSHLQRACFVVSQISAEGHRSKITKYEKSKSNRYATLNYGIQGNRHENTKRQCKEIEEES